MGRRPGLASIRPPRILVTKYIYIYFHLEMQTLKNSYNCLPAADSFLISLRSSLTVQSISTFFRTIISLHIFKPSLFFLVLRDVNPLLVLLSYFCQFHFNCMISFTSRSYKRSLLFIFSHHIPVHTSLILHTFRRQSKLIRR